MEQRETYSSALSLAYCFRPAPKESRNSNLKSKQHAIGARPIWYRYGTNAATCYSRRSSGVKGGRGRERLTVSLRQVAAVSNKNISDVNDTDPVDIFPRNAKVLRMSGCCCLSGTVVVVCPVWSG